MPYRMSEAICVPNAPWWLSTRYAGFANAWASPRCVLRRLLLDADDTSVCGRRDERALDRPPRVAHSLEEDHSLGLSPCSLCWHSLHRGRRVVVGNGNVLTAQGRSPLTLIVEMAALLAARSF